MTRTGHRFKLARAPAILALLLLSMWASKTQGAENWHDLKSAGEQAEIDQDYGRAERWYLQALQEVERPGHSRAQLIETSAHLAASYVAQGKFEQAEPLFQRVMATAAIDQSKGQNPEELVWLDDLADAYARVAQTKPELCLKHCIAIRAQISQRHTKLNNSYEELISYYIQHKQPQKALPYAEKQLAMLNREGPRARQQAAQCLVVLGNLSVDLGKFAQARSYFQKAGELITRSSGASYPLEAQINRWIGDTYAAQKNLTAAENSYKLAFDLDRKIDAGKGALEAVDLSSLAELHAKSGKYSLSEQFYRQSLEVIERQPGVNPILAAEIYIRLARVLEKEHKNGEAAKLQARANRFLPAEKLLQPEKR